MTSADGQLADLIFRRGWGPRGQGGPQRQGGARGAGRARQEGEGTPWGSLGREGKGGKGGRRAAGTEAAACRVPCSPLCIPLCSPLCIPLCSLGSTANKRKKKRKKIRIRMTIFCEKINVKKPINVHFLTSSLSSERLTHLSSLSESWRNNYVHVNIVPNLPSGINEVHLVLHLKYSQCVYMTQNLIIGFF